MITDTVDKYTRSTYETQPIHQTLPKLGGNVQMGIYHSWGLILPFFFFFFPRAELQMKGTNALGSQQSTTKHKSVPTALAWRKENHLGKSDTLLWNHWFSCCTVIQLDKKGKISTAEVFALGSDTGDNAKFSSHSRTNRNCELSTTLMNIHSKGGV